MFDWLTLTLPGEDDAGPGEFFPGAESWEWIEQPRGGVSGYRREQRCGSLRFFSGHRVKGEGVMLLLTGAGCRELEARSLPLSSSASPFDWQGWGAYLLGRGVHCTRLDLAVDDKQGILDLETIARSIERGELTRESTEEPTYHGKLAPGGRKLETIYLGNARSATRVCIYDKAGEQGEEGHWIRAEVRWRRGRAQAALALFVAGGVEPLLGAFRKAVCFREPSNDSNRSRWPVARWWQQLLGAVSPVALSVAPKMRTLADKYVWLRDYVAPTLAMVVKWQGRGQPVWNLVRVGMKRLSPAQLALIESARGESLALSAI